jgi:hypothetical protein
MQTAPKPPWAPPKKKRKPTSQPASYGNRPVESIPYAHQVFSAHFSQTVNRRENVLIAVSHTKALPCACREMAPLESLV